MLNKSEIEKLLHKKERIMVDQKIQEEAVNWDQPSKFINPSIVAMVYTYMKSKYNGHETLDDMVKHLGFCPDWISLALKMLEQNGYLTISRSTKPYRYAVIK